MSVPTVPQPNPILDWIREQYATGALDYGASGARYPGLGGGYLLHDFYRQALAGNGQAWNAAQYQQWLASLAGQGYADPSNGFAPTRQFFTDALGFRDVAGELYDPQGNWSDEQWNTINAASGARYAAPTYEQLTNAGYRVERPQSAYAQISSAPTVTPTVTGNSSAGKVYAQQSIARRQQPQQPYRPRPFIGGY